MRWLFVFILSFTASAQTIPDHLKKPIGPAQARLILDQVRESDLLTLMIQFVGCCHPSRIVGTPSHLKAHQWFESHFQTYDQPNIRTKTMPFEIDVPFAVKHFESQSADILKHLPSEDSKTRQEILALTQSRSQYLNQLQNKSAQGKNFFFEIKGNQKPDEILLFVTHFDTMTINKEKWELDLESVNLGADANASAVAVFLMMMKLFSQLNLPRTVQFLFLDAQSFGSLGARAYISEHLKSLQSQKIHTMHVMTIGQRPPRKIHIRMNEDGSYQKDDQAVVKDFMTRAQRLSPGLSFELNGYSPVKGDHDVFWEAGLSGALLTQNWDNEEILKRHHTSQDFVESLDRRAYFRSFRYIAGGALSWAYQYSL